MNTNHQVSHPVEWVLAFAILLGGTASFQQTCATVLVHALDTTEELLERRNDVKTWECNLGFARIRCVPGHGLIRVESVFGNLTL